MSMSVIEVDMGEVMSGYLALFVMILLQSVGVWAIIGMLGWSVDFWAVLSAITWGEIGFMLWRARK